MGDGVEAGVDGLDDLAQDGDFDLAQSVHG